MGYTIAKFDESEYTFREILENFIKSKNLSGKSLDIGGGQWTFPQKEYAAISFDKIKWPNVDVVGDVCQLDKYFSNTKFDVIFFTETLEHVENPFVAIQNIYKILNKGGVLIASAPFKYPLHGEEYGDYWRFTRQGWQSMLQDFSLVEILPIGKENFPHHYIIYAKK